MQVGTRMSLKRSSYWAALFAAACLPAISCAQATACVTADLSLGGSAEATLDANDCPLRDAIGGGTSTAFAKRYKVTVAADSIATLDLESAAFDTLLLLYTADTPSRLLASNDNAPNHPTNSRILMSLPPGDYHAIVSSPRAGLSGAFKLTTQRENPRTCPVLPVNTAGVTESSFGPNSCRFLDLLPLSVNATFIQFYGFTLDKDGVVTIRANSAIPRFSMVVTLGGTLVARGEREMTFSFPAGIEPAFSVSSPDMGTYALETSVEDPRACPEEPISVGAEVSATLENGGCRLLDYLIPLDFPSPLRLYRFELSSPAVVTIDQTSPLVDSLLFLFDDDRLLSSNDNRAAGVRDSRITMHLPAGTYYAGASAANPAQLGAFSLKVAAEAPRTCPVPALPSGEALEGNLSAEGCRHLDFVPFSTNTAFVTPFRLESQGRKTAALRLRSSATGMLLSLLSPSSTELLRQLVSAQDRTFTGDVTMLNGQHTVLLWSNTGTAPTYNLTATVSDPRNCPPADLGLNDVQDGTLEGAECRVSDVVPYFLLASQVKTYKVTLPARGRLTVSMEPGSNFVPRLIAMRGTDTVIGQHAPTASVRASLSGLLAAGEYYFQATTSTAPGPFTIRAAFQPDGVVSAFKAGKQREGTMEEVTAGSPRDRILEGLHHHESRQ